MAIVARAQPHVDPRRVTVLVAHRHRPTTMPYLEVVEEAICFGWIDSTANLLDDDRGLQLITPRKAKALGPDSTANAPPKWNGAAS